MVKITLVTYYTPKWKASADRLVNSASVDVVRAWTRKELQQSDYYQSHCDILDQPQGGGYWLWKPHYILQALQDVEEGDVVIYADAGVAFVAPDLLPLITLCRKEGGILLFAGHYEEEGGPGPNVNSRWTHGECFRQMEADSRDFHGACQADASFMVFIRNDQSVCFVKKWLDYCENPAILTDIGADAGENLPNFVDHRHDQSVLSILAVRHDIILHRSPSQFGNHLKAPAQRVTGEWCKLPYVNSPFPDRYPTLLDHHRGARPKQ